MAEIKNVQVNYLDGTSRIFDAALVLPSPPPPPAPSNFVKGGYFDAVPDTRARELADQFGMGWVRTWHAVDWSKPPTANQFDRQRRLQDAGLKVLTVFTPYEGSGTAPATAAIGTEYFRSALYAANGAIDAWEIWNEPNLPNYNKDYYADNLGWMERGLKPAYDVLKQAGKTVVSGGWSGEAGGQFAWHVKNGLLNYCDIVGYHPYGGSAAQQLAYVQEVRSAVGPTKPIWLTEWNLHVNQYQPQVWMDQLKEAATSVKPLVQGIFHFRMTANNSRAGVAAPYTPDLARRPVWYEGTKAAMEVL